MYLLSTIPLKYWWVWTSLQLFSTPPSLSWFSFFHIIKLSYNLHVAFFLQFFIALSCLISVSVNFSTFLVIGKTSAVTYQVLGHLKTCLVLAFGYVLLHDPFSWRNILGILVAVVGMVLYSYYCTVESQQKANEVSAQLSQVVHIFPFCTFMFMPLSTFPSHPFCLEITNQRNHTKCARLPSCARITSPQFLVISIWEKQKKDKTFTLGPSTFM